MHAAARLCGFPRGVGDLVSAATRRKLVGSLLGSFLLSVLDMVGVLAMLPMMQFISGAATDQGALGLIDRVLGNPGRTTLVTALAAIIVGAFVIKDCIAIVLRRWQLHFMAAQEAETSVQLLNGLLVGPYERHLQRSTSDRLWLVSQAVTIGFSGGLTAALGLITEVLTIGLLVISLVIVSPVPTLLATIYFGIAGVVLQRTVRKRSRVVGERNSIFSQRAVGLSMQALGAAKEIKLRRAHEPFVAEYAAAENAAAHSRATAVLLLEIPKYFLEIVFVIGIGVLALTATTADSGQSALVVLGVFVAAGSRILPSTVRLIAATSGIRFATAPLEILVREHQDQTDALNREHDRVVTSAVPRGNIRVRDVTFVYADRPGELVLRGIDLDIPSGRSVAIVGSSGAGKSTLVDILLGLQHPRSGSVTAGGVEVFDNLPAWQQRLAVVPQEVYLLDQSLGRNIAFDQEPDPTKLARVVRRAQLGDLVASLPDGLDTEVGERGDRLSGGQRQRIGIARALYRDPEVLVLDEATSALDNDTERRLTGTIEELAGSITIVIVAHRLSTVRHCDALVFMKDGRVQDVGTFDEVIHTNADFANLVRLGDLNSATH